jgi:hypothetical protein
MKVLPYDWAFRSFRREALAAKPQGENMTDQPESAIDKAFASLERLKQLAESPGLSIKSQVSALGLVQE